MQKGYYIDGRPQASDREYDRLFDELLRLEQEFPDLRTADSPGNRVGSDLSAEFPEVAHKVPVLSLDKAYKVDQLHSWIERTMANTGLELSFVIEEKLDGISIVLYYENGVLSRAVTRGNGAVGNDVTANIRTIRTVPLRLPRNIDVAVRGEIVLPISEFDELNRRQAVPYANPRNLASGTIRRIKSSEVAAVPLAMFAYEGYYADQPAAHHLILADLVDLGFSVNEHIGFFSENNDISFLAERFPSAVVGRIAEIEQFVEQETRQRRDRPYELDGLVVKVNEIAVRDDLGFTEHHPRWAIAYKFEAPEAQTVVRAIDVQVGRTGRITPVARVEPVSVSGARISNITLHNQDYINSLELSVGDTVAISRRGDVIPAVERVIEKSETAQPVWQMPAICPSCSSELVRIGAHHFCTNFDCPDRRRGLLYFFAGTSQMDIESLGPETLDILVQEGFVSDPVDLYTFDFDRLHGYPGFGDRKIALIKDGIERSKERPFHTVLPSIGIPELGPKVTELLIDAGIRSIDELFAIVDSGDQQALIAIRGVGERTAEVIFRELANPAVRSEIERLKAAGLQFEERGDTEPQLASEPIFAGQTWCVTGSFEQFKPRSLATDEVKLRGGRVVGDVSGSTTHLLAGTAAGSKLEKARALGIVIVDEAAFLALIGKSPS